MWLPRMQAANARLRAQNAGLQAENAELKAQLAQQAEKIARLERLISRNSGNSSMPPSADDLPGKKPPQREGRPGGKKRKPGKQRGVPGACLAWNGSARDYQELFAPLAASQSRLRPGRQSDGLYLSACCINGARLDSPPYLELLLPSNPRSWGARALIGVCATGCFMHHRARVKPSASAAVRSWQVSS